MTLSVREFTNHLIEISKAVQQTDDVGLLIDSKEEVTEFKNMLCKRVPSLSFDQAHIFYSAYWSEYSGHIEQTNARLNAMSDKALAKKYFEICDAAAEQYFGRCVGDAIFDVEKPRADGTSVYEKNGCQDLAGKMQTVIGALEFARALTL